MYSVGRNGPPTSSWTPHLRTRRSDVVPVPLPTPSYVDAYALRWIYANALSLDAGASLDDLHEAVSTLEDAERTAQRVLGGAHPSTAGIEGALREARAMLRARETG